MQLHTEEGEGESRMTGDEVVGGDHGVDEGLESMNEGGGVEARGGVGVGRGGRGVVEMVEGGGSPFVGGGVVEKVWRLLIGVLRAIYRGETNTDSPARRSVADLGQTSTLVLQSFPRHLFLSRCLIFCIVHTLHEYCPVAGPLPPPHRHPHSLGSGCTSGLV